MLDDSPLVGGLSAVFNRRATWSNHLELCSALAFTAEGVTIRSEIDSMNDMEGDPNFCWPTFPLDY